MLGLRFCARAFSSCGKRGPLFIAVRGPLTIATSLVAEHRLQTRRLSSCGARAQLLRGMWDFPRPGLEPTSPALAGRFSTTVPAGKPCLVHFDIRIPVGKHKACGSGDWWVPSGRWSHALLAVHDDHHTTSHSEQPLVSGQQDQLFRVCTG